MMGYVTKVYVQIGKVSAGQTLVSINNSDLKAKKAQADAILQATAGYNNAKKDYDRFVTLFKQQSAQKRIDDMTARYEMTKGLEGQNKCEMKFWHSLIHSITAPFSLGDQYLRERRRYGHPGMP
jgi:multidrug resistance efflux pump